MDVPNLDRRVKIEIRCYGIGRVLRFVHDYFFALRALHLALSCVLLALGIRLPFFAAALVEFAALWCRFRAPAADRERRAEFARWVNSSITANGGESCHFANVLFAGCYEKMLPDTLGESLCPLASAKLQSLLPSFVRNVSFTAISFGAEPPKLLQAITEKPPFDNSLSLRMATVLSGSFSLEVSFSVFSVPITLVITNAVMYGDLRVIIEAPEKNVFLNTSVITCMAFTFEGRPTVLSADVYLNGFNLARIPMAQSLISLVFEHFISLVMANGECVVWDWIRNSFSLRNISRLETALSNRLFSPIAHKSSMNSSLGRFSLPNEIVERYDQIRKINWDRARKAKLKPNEMLLNMSPRNGQETEPVFPFSEEKRETVDNGTQTEKDVGY